MNLRRTLPLVLALAVPAVAMAQQGVPEVLPYQGMLYDNTGAPYTGTVDMTFRMYPVGQGGQAVWTETIPQVPVDNGLFAVYLGQGTAVGPYFVDGSNKYLGIQVGEDLEATPRQNIGSVPFALLAGNSLRLGGDPAEDFARVADLDDLIDQDDIAEIVDRVIVERELLTREVLNEVLIDRQGLSLEDLERILAERGFLNEAQVRIIIEEYIDALELIIQGQQGEIDALEVLVAALQVQVNELREDVDALEVVVANQAVQIEELTEIVQALQVTVNQLQNNNNAAGAPFILGISAATTSGRLVFNGTNGLRGADAMCRAAYAAEPTAHLCTTHEVHRAVASGSYTANGNFNGVNTWTVAEAINGVSFGNTLGNTCQGMLYNSADVARGTRLSVVLNFTSPGNGGNVSADVFRIDQEVLCSTEMPVLCCR